MANGSGKLVGIDLGTTFSAISTLDDNGQAVTLPNREGEMLTPSVVFLDGTTTVVGQAARDVALEQPDKVASLIKRRMGHPTYGRVVDGREFRLGGQDWDDRVVDYVAAQFQKQFGEDPRSDPMALASLTSAAERAKRTLSKLPQTSITCTHAGRVLTVPLTRTEFEGLTRDL